MQALRELQPLLQSPQVGLAAKAALIYASGVAEDHDKDVAVASMATELDVSISVVAMALLLLPEGTCTAWLCSKLHPVATGAEHCCTTLSSPPAGNLVVAHWFPRACQSLCRACPQAYPKRCCRLDIAWLDFDPTSL